MEDWGLRHRIFRAFAESGSVPAAADLEEWAGGRAEAETALGRLHEAHVLVLGARGEIRMALPFSGVATSYRVTTATARYWANCAWDTFGIAALLRVDATIDSVCLDDPNPFVFQVRAGTLSGDSGFVHFVIPARRWWDDIVDT